jgi:hypothetical protein
MNAEEGQPMESEAASSSVAEPKEATSATRIQASRTAPFGYRIPADHRWAGLWRVWAGLGVVGLALAGVGYAVDARRFAFSYLFSFMCALSLALGSLFFILVERLTSAAWSVTVRRLAELVASGFPALVVLFLPVVLCMGSLFPWLHEGAGTSAEAQETTSNEACDRPTPALHPEERAPTPRVARTEPHQPDRAEVTRPGQPHTPGLRATPPAGSHPTHADGAGVRGEHRELVRLSEALEAREEQTLAKKAGYLNRGFFLARVVLYFAAWLFVAYRLVRLSIAQDATGDPAYTRRAQRFAPIATILFALSLTLAVVDWVMSLDPTWSSTIFGVTFFAGCAVTIFAALTVLAMALRNAGLVKDAVNEEHFHDLGKLLFGFLVFWAYVNFSQFMLIWYAALPEETTFYHRRWDVGPWAYVSLLIVVAHFVVPFFLLLSRNAKRRLPLLRLGAIWILVMHVVDVYWLVMPNYNHGDSTVSWIDFACLVGVVGVYLAVVFRNMTRYPLIPVGDPRLARSLAFENT